MHAALAQATAHVAQHASEAAHHASGAAHHAPGMVVPWYGILPFAALLACIAILPLIPATEKLWEKNWFQLTVALFFGLPMGLWMWLGGEHHHVVHSLVEYGQFMVLLLSLYVVSGGIFVSGDIRATPGNNSIFMILGAVLASFIGTTGAAMLLIRPLLNTNKERENKVHTVVFAIFMIANCGGLLTPLGDPPLFMGMLRGVPFLWTMTHLLPEWLFTNTMLLLAYYALDRKLYASEKIESIALDDSQIEPIGVVGKINFLWLAVIVLAVALLPSVNMTHIFEGKALWHEWVPFREFAMLSMAVFSFFLGSKKTRFEKNLFEWGPILEVGALFIGIFLAMVPALQYLGQVAPSLPLNEVTFFAFTGGLSAVLDNTPTYVVFFDMAAHLPKQPHFIYTAGVPEIYLAAISVGAVFAGAITYIGNGPNFMVKAIAESANVKMPSFGGYTLKWAFRFLVPILVLMLMIFIVQDNTVKGIGIFLSAVRVAMYLWQAHLYPDPHKKTPTKA